MACTKIKPGIIAPSKSKLSSRIKALQIKPGTKKRGNVNIPVWNLGYMFVWLNNTYFFVTVKQFHILKNESSFLAVYIVGPNCCSSNFNLSTPDSLHCGGALTNEGN